VRINLLMAFIISMISACGLSTQEEIDNAITQAHQLLTDKKCAEAIAVLNEAGQQTSNPDWLSAMASAQACLAPWNVVRFFETDLDNLGTADETAIIGSTATFTQAVMTSPTDSSYTNMRAAINTLLSAGGITDISYANRAAVLGSAAASNLAVQTLYMMLNQIGQYSRYYGNALATTGLKGSGAAVNECYLTYTDTDAKTYIDGVPGGLGSCDDTDTDTGRAELNGNRARMCEGIVLFNNFIDILANVSLDPTGNNGDIGDLDELADDIEDICAQATIDYGINFGGTCTVKTQSVCEANADGTYNQEHLERYFALIWEGLHQ
jgi:hypothetical protein